MKTLYGVCGTQEAFDHAPREVIWLALKRKESWREKKAIKEMHVNIKTSVSVECVRSESLHVKIGIH